VVRNFTRADLAREFATRGFKRGAEIGVADGRNSLTLCQAIPGLHLIGVDPWTVYKGNPRGGPQSQHDNNYELATERLKGYDVKFWVGFSHSAVHQVPLESLDFVYIDGNHGYEFVKQDIELWSQRVRKGGIVAGHDFYHFKWAGVVQAVEDYTRENGITDWHVTSEREPSFWWVK
jgi:hypothetical protein